MFGKKYCTKFCKGDIFSLFCVLVILITLSYQTFVGIFASEHLERLKRALQQDEIVEIYTGRIKRVYYEPLIFSNKADNSEQSANFYVKGSDKTLLFSVTWTSDYSINEVLVKDGLYSYRKAFRIKANSEFSENIFFTSIPNHIITILILSIFRVLCGLFPSQIMRIVEFPNRLFKVGRFQDTIFPFIFLCNGGLVIVGFNLLRSIYIVAF